ncbi:MarR family winged helix-turn-helix transcriptional regulator [Jatrophihabitans sp. DSM 45814]
MTDANWLNDSEHRMWRAFRSMHTSLDRVLEQEMSAESGLSSADFAVLVPLSEAPDRRLRARDLGLQMTWDRSRLSHQIKRMEQRGLIERTDCPTDARGTFIQLTEKGWRTIEAAAPPHVAAVRAYFVDLLTEDEIDSLTAISEKVHDKIAARAAEGVCDGDD